MMMMMMMMIAEEEDDGNDNGNDDESRIIHHSHSFTRLEIYHHIYFIYHTFNIQILAVCRIFVP